MSENLLDQLGFFKLKAMVGTALSAARVLFASRIDPPFDSPVLIGISWDEPAGEVTVCNTLIAAADGQAHGRPVLSHTGPWS